MAEIETLIGTSTDYAKVTKGYEAQVKALRTAKDAKAKALATSYEKGTAVADFVERMFKLGRQNSWLLLRR